MKLPRLGLPGLIVLCLAAYLVYSAVQLRSMHAELTTRSSDVAKAYRIIAERYALPLRSKGTLTPSQERSMAGVTSALKALSVAPDTFIRVEQIRNLQLSLQSLLSSIPNDSVLGGTGEAISLRRSMGEQAPVRSILEPYNLVAKRWNGAAESRFSRLLALPIGMNLRKISMLRFDGVEEFETTVSL